MIEHDVDVLLIGGGVIGAALAHALNQLGYHTLLIDNHPVTLKTNPGFDARSLALSPASIRILKMLNLWNVLEEKHSPIQQIHISDQHRFGVSRLRAKPHEPLGTVVEMHHLNQALYHSLTSEHIIAPATVTHLDLVKQEAIITSEDEVYKIRARLFVAADGAQSTVRTLAHLPVHITKYNQQAVLANIGLEKPHQGQAFERFTPQGPLALLPMQGNRMSLVWAMNPDKVPHVLALTDRLFLQELQRAFGYRLGRLLSVGARVSYPLQQALMPIQAQWPLVFIGNAAHTLHPVAGQGFNLGLRDVACLAQCIAKQGLQSNMLEDYLALRTQDQHNIIRFTNGLIRVFGSRLPGMGLARDLGLFLLDNSTILQKCVLRWTQGYGGIIPDLVCGIALDKRDA